MGVLGFRVIFESVNKDGPGGREAGVGFRLLRQMSEEQTNFKVTDRRLFNADGTPRELSPEEMPAPSTTPPAAATVDTDSVRADTPGQSAQAATSAGASPAKTAPASAEKAEAIEDSGIPDVDNPASFINFAMSIASNAASSLGMVEHPVTRKREVDLELAKHWIDLLGMLQHKTRGNLVLEEEQILEGWLADLRMQYVSLTSAASSEAPRPYTGRDIIGGK
jgi:hypothetical protein